MLIEPHRLGTYLELGTWTGMGSTKYVAETFPKMTMICIDNFEGSAETRDTTARRKIADELWDHFCANHWHNRKRLFPFKTNTAAGMVAVAAAGIEPDVIYIDASHDQESVYRDINTALMLFPKSVIIGDDYGQTHPGVKLAISQAIKDGLFAQQEFMHIRHVDSTDGPWYLDRNLKT